MKKITVFCIAAGLTVLLAGVPALAGDIRIADTEYDTLQDAVQAGEEGNIIMIGADVVTDEPVIINNTDHFIIDFDNHSYEYTGDQTAFMLTSGGVTLKNAKLQSNSYVIQSYEDTTISVENGIYTGFWSNSGSVLIKDGSFDSRGASLDGSSEYLFMNYGTLVIMDGTFLARTDDVINNAGCTLVADGSFCSLKAQTVHNAGGSLILNGGKYRTTFHDECVLVNDEGMTLLVNPDMYGTIRNNGTDEQPLRITDGNYHCDYNKALYNYSGTCIIENGTFVTVESALDNVEGATLIINDGTFISKSHYYTLYNEGNAVINAGYFQSSLENDAFVTVGENASIILGDDVVYTGESVRK